MLGVTAGGGGGGGHVPLCHPAESAPALEIHQLFSSKQTTRPLNRKIIHSGLDICICLITRKS